MPRRTSLRRFFLFALASTATLGLVGCFGAVGDICQVASDCNTGLVCCKRGDVEARGVCATTTTACAPVGTDAGPPVDAGPRDAGVRDSAVDASTDDAGGDAAVLDAGPVDAGDVDAGTDAGTLDAGADAGDVDAGDVDAATDDAGDAG